METSINNLYNIIKKSNTKIITINEVSHWSFSSHTYHYELVKKLYENNIINTFSSERLGLLDAMFMNLWLEGKINCSLKYLYKYILPFGGLGTYRWMNYFKNNNCKINLVGLEADFYWSLNSKELLNTLKQFLSPEFVKYIKLDGSKLSDKAKDNIKNKYDKIVYIALHQTYLHKLDYKYRYKIWYKNMIKIIDKTNNLFINGFHLSKSSYDLGIKLKNKYNNVLICGMTSYHIYMPIYKLNNTWLKKYNLSINDYLEYGQKFWDIYAKFITDNEININFKKIKNLSKYIQPSILEKKYKNIYYILNTSKENGYISNYGAFVIPIMDNYKTRNIKYADNTMDYDYIIFIPKSIIKSNKMAF